MIAEQLRTLAVPLASLNLDPSNARVHGEKNLAAIRSSLAQFGQRKPVVVQRAGMIVRAGNGTVQAAKALGWTEIAALVVDDDNATAVQFAIADNRTAELAEWDPDTLATLLDGMDAAAQAAVGFDSADVDKLLKSLAPELSGGGPVDDEGPEPPPAVATARRGDLWILGDHRLLCGDSTNLEDVRRLMNGEKAALVATDPPYLVDYAKLVAEFDLLTASAKSEDDLQRIYLLTREGFLKGAVAEFVEKKDATSRFLLAALITTDEDVLNVIRREIRKVTEILVPTETIAEMLRNEVVKREALEGEEATNAARAVSRASKVAKAPPEQATAATPVPPSPAPVDG